MQQYPFQIKDHGDKVIEMIVGDVIGPEHKVAEALRVLLKKFDFVILSLKETASLHPSFAATMAELSEAGRLLVVAHEDDQIQVDLHQAKRYTELQAAQKRVGGERNIAKILDKISSLPLAQSSAHKLLSMLRSPSVTFDDIEEVTSKDPKLVMRMLKIANSAHFMRRMPYENLKSVVTFLGLDGIREIILQETFEGFANLFANQREKLAHMRRCAHLATYIGKLTGADLNLLSKLNSAGLLHDIGALALCFYDGQEYARAIMKVRNDKLTICDAELEVFGIDHQELGQLLAQKLAMPDYLGPAMARHHDQTVPVDNRLLISIMVANGYLNQHIENMPFTFYEKYLPTLAEERRNKIITSAIAGKYSHNLPKISKIVAEKDKRGEIFKIPELYEVLKTELDQFMLAGTEALGM